MTMRQIGLVLVLVSSATVTAYGSQPQTSSQSGMHDGMQQSGSMEKGQKESTQEYKITLRTEPNPAKGSQENTFHISVTDANGKPVSDGTVKITLVMPAMPQMNMAERRVSPVVAWNGSDYSGKANIPSAGLWNVDVQVLKQNHVVASKKAQLVTK
jgi:hypothetical protein